jgi:hypothetical protein
MPSQAEYKASHRVLAETRKVYPQGQDLFKENHPERVLTHLVKPFNPSYPKFTRTKSGGSISWGLGWKDSVRSGEWNATVIRAHEGQHMWDWKRLKFLFPVLYGLPHCLAPLFLLPYCILGGLWALISVGSILAGLGLAYARPGSPRWFYPWAISGSLVGLAISVVKLHWLTAYLAGFYGLLSPLANYLGAAYGRAWLEIRGYTIELAALYWKRGFLLESDVTRIVGLLSGPAYYYAMPWRGLLTKILRKRVVALLDGSLELEEVWLRKMHQAIDAVAYVKVKR